MGIRVRTRNVDSVVQALKIVETSCVIIKRKNREVYFLLWKNNDILLFRGNKLINGFSTALTNIKLFLHILNMIIDQIFLYIVVKKHVKNTRLNISFKLKFYENYKR